MALLTIVPPVSEPVTLADAKLFLRLDAGFTDDDALIGSLIAAARRWSEVYTQRRFIRQTVRLLMDFFPGYIDFKLAGQKVSSPFVSGANAVLVGIRYAIILPYPPVRAIVGFEYLDENGNTTAMTAGTNYVADIDSQPARLMPPFGQMWPVARVIANAVHVDYVSGYGANATVSMQQASTAITGYKFLASDAGAAITIPGAGAGGNDLATTIDAVDDNGNGTAADAAQTAVNNAPVYVGEPLPDSIQIAMKLLVSNWYEKRLPDDGNIPMAVKSLLYPYRDLRF